MWPIAITICFLRSYRAPIPYIWWHGCTDRWLRYTNIGLTSSKEEILRLNKGWYVILPVSWVVTEGKQQAQIDMNRNLIALLCYPTRSKLGTEYNIGRAEWSNNCLRKHYWRYSTFEVEIVKHKILILITKILISIHKHININLCSV